VRVRALNIKPRQAVILILAILVTIGFLDWDMCKALLTWCLGGLIVLLLNIAFFGNLIKQVMKTKDVQDLIRLFGEVKEKIKELVEIQNGNNPLAR